MTQIVLSVLAVLGMICGTDCRLNLNVWTNPGIASLDGTGALTPGVAESAVGSLGLNVTAIGISNFVITTQPTADKITIDAASGALSLAAGQSLDFETTATYLLTIEGDGGSGSTGTITATLSITDVDESPVFSQSTVSVTVAIDSAADTNVTMATATDPEDDTITYAISGGNTNTDFSIDSSSGLIKVVNQLNQTVTPAYNLTVTGTDPGSNAGTATVSISVSASTVNSACAGLIVIMTIMLCFVF